jgi:hypothetical protein
MGEPLAIASDYCSMIRPAVVSAFERNGWEGAWHTDVDEWLWNGEKRKASLSLEPILSNWEEFGEHGLVDIDERPLHTTGGIQMARIALLNPRHISLYSILSRAPRAREVRFLMIDIFEAARAGQIATASRMDLRVIEVACQQMVAPILARQDETLKEQREFHTQVLTKMEQTDRRVITIESKLLGIERASLRFMDKPFTPRTRRLHQQHVWSQYAGMCPCCRVVQIVKENAERLPACNDEHYSGRAKNKLHQTWLTCAECNQRLLDLDYHGAKHQVFVNYQDSMRHFLSVELKKQTILF